jgi:16S rRNA (cytidine1402-2'-O)-methyltransferase
MKTTKRQDLPAGLWPGLWIVATPIGNLADMTPRARLALESADQILAEDTRRTAQLLSALGISGGGNRISRFDEHTPQSQIHSWVEQLLAGKNLALVSDAGTPAVSDPGALLTFAAHDAGVRVSPVPGVSAVTALLSVSGVRENSFSFRGFFPRESKSQRLELSTAVIDSMTSIFLWFESPQRIVKTLEFIGKEHAKTRVVVGKEITKIHEKIFSGPAVEVGRQVRDEVEREGALGEWAFLLDFSKGQSPAIGQDSDGSTNSTIELEKFWKIALVCLKKSEISLSDAVSVVSQEFGISKKSVYAAALVIFEKKLNEGG